MSFLFVCDNCPHRDRCEAAQEPCTHYNDSTEEDND